MATGKLRIVHVLTRLLRAGSEENTMQSCKAQRAAGHDVWLVHGREFDPEVKRRAEAVATVVAVPSMMHPIAPFSDVRAVRDLARLFREIGPDVVHTHQSKAGVLGRVAARLARARAVIHSVHILPFVNVGAKEAAIYTFVERACAPLTDAFIHVSPSVRGEYETRGIGAGDRHFVAFSAMEVDRFKAASPPQDWRALLGVEAGAAKPPTALMLAAFEPRKRHLEFIRAVPGAFAGLPDWRVVFAGEGADEAPARELVASLGLQDKVRFAGYRKDPEALIAMADVSFLTSMREGLPRVVVQYAAAGKPIVATRLPGLTDVLGDEANAVIVDFADVAGAARQVARLLGDEAARADFAGRARGIDVDRWSPASMDRDVRAAYAAAFLSRGIDPAIMRIGA